MLSQATSIDHDMEVELCRSAKAAVISRKRFANLTNDPKLPVL